MATGFPASTGDVLTAPMFNELVQFTINTQSGATYTLAATDQYQVLILTSNSGTKTVSIPTDATTNFAIGTAVTIINTGAGDLTVNAVTPATTTISSIGATSTAPVVAQWKSCAAVKVAANSWIVVGGVA